MIRLISRRQSRGKRSHKYIIRFSSRACGEINHRCMRSNDSCYLSNAELGRKLNLAWMKYVSSRGREIRCIALLAALSADCYTVCAPCLRNAHYRQTFVAGSREHSLVTSSSTRQRAHLTFHRPSPSKGDHFVIRHNALNE